MKRRNPLRLSLVVLSLFVLGCNSSGKVSVGPGRNVPDFEIQELGSGKKVSFGAVRGKLTILHFWASWCGPCIQEMPELNRLYGELKDTGVTVVAIGIDDSVGELKKFSARLQVTFPLFFDSAGNLGRRFGLTGVPETFIVDESGKFLLMEDPDDGEPRVRFVGPRGWANPSAIARIRALVR